jgi:ankyrin repeat protein
MRVQLVKWLVAHGAKPDLRDSFGGSALVDCMNQGTEAHVDIIAYLRGRGAGGCTSRVVARDEKGFTPL